MKIVYAIVSAILLSLFLLATDAAYAQNPEQAIVDLNNQAMEAYNNLDVNRAISLLDQALSAAQKSGVTSGQLIAGTHLNLGIVYVGGAGNKQNGFEQFVRACCLFPSIQLDPLVSTPDIAATFQQAQQSAASGGCAAVGVAPPVAVAPIQPVVPPPVVVQQPVMQQPIMQQPAMQPVIPPAVPGMLQIIHQPPAPQLSQAPLPLYIEIPNAMGVSKVQVFYRGLGMDTFKSVEMLPYGMGYAYQISCREVWEPRVRYYFVASGSDDRILATAGSAQSTYEAMIVSALQGPGPSFPGASSPGPCLDVECPPGVSGEACKKPLYHGVGQGCEEDTDCQPGLACKDDMCVIPGATGNMGAWAVDDGWKPPEKVGDFARAFVQVGFAMGFAWVSAGKVTDSGPPANTIVGGTGQFRVDTAWVPDADSYDIDPVTLADRKAGNECPADGVVTRLTQQKFPSRYCARVGATGYVFTPALRLTAGYFIIPRLSLAGIFRLQFGYGQTTLAGMLFGARAEYMILQPREKGLMISAFLGGSAGQIQVKPPPSPMIPNQKVPYIISGLMGVHVGATVRYRFKRFIGAFVSPEIDIQFPDSLFNMDVTLGPEVSF